MLPLPSLMIWALGAAGTVVLMKLFGKEWERVNSELERFETGRASETERATMQTLRRDPVSGDYRADH